MIAAIGGDNNWIDNESRNLRQCSNGNNVGGAPKLVRQIIDRFHEFRRTSSTNTEFKEYLKSLLLG